MNFLENEFFLLAVTFGIFFLAKLLQKKTGIMLLNPILLTIAILIVFLKMTHISYETYNEGGHLIEFWLNPLLWPWESPYTSNWKRLRNSCSPSCCHNLPAALWELSLSC